WATAAAAAIFAGLVWHALHPLFADSAMFQRPLERVYSGGSAAAFGMLGGYAALSRRPWAFVAIFVAWESGYWIVKENFITIIHFAGLFSVLGLMRRYLGRRARRSRLDTQTT